MLFKYYYGFIYVAGLFKLRYCQERNEQEVDTALGKKFVVYFVESPSSKKEDDTWLCGGALVSPTQILTAAACLVQAEKIYAIAGYKKYIDARDIENDECTRARKQRVVRILIPREYKLPHEHPLPTINVDVGVAIVEKPYNFSDLTYRVHCSYEPQPIFVNFEKKYELESTHAMAFGWTSINPQSPSDAKSQILQEAFTVIVDKKVCSSAVNTQELVHTMEEYLLCASRSIIDGKKDIKLETPEKKDCKVRRYDLMKAIDSDGCFEDDFGFRKNGDIKTNGTGFDKDTREILQLNYTEIKNETNVESSLYTSVNSRRSSLITGPCQNGHGCPLIKWVGDKEIVIGVASNANENKDCNGPYLYVSTAATSKIIKCLLETNSITRKFCNEEISDKRYVVQEIEVNWPDLLQKPHVPKMPIVQRAVQEDPQLVLRPTKDIYFLPRTNEKRDYKTYNSETSDQSYKQVRAKSHNQNTEAPHNGILRQSYDQQQPEIRIQQPIEQKVEQQHPHSTRQVANPSLNQQLAEAPVSPHYGPLMEQQYELPQGQYEQPPDQGYVQELSPGQQYNLQLRQQYDPQQRQQFDQQPDQEYAQQPGQEYISPAEQAYNQQYDSQTGQIYQSPEGPQYDPPIGQKYGQQYKLPPSQQYESLPEQQYETPLRQQYRLPPGQQYIPEQQNDPPPGQQFESPSAKFGQPYEQQYQPRLAQYDSNLAQQYQQQAEQNIPVQNSHYQHQVSQPQRIGQPQMTRKEQQYNLAPIQSPQVSTTPAQTKMQKQHLHVFDHVPNQQSSEKMDLQNKKSPVSTYLKSRSFDQIFSEIHNLPNETPPTASVFGHDETFEQLYSHLHEPSFDLPHELTIPKYSVPPDDPYEENVSHTIETSNTQQSENGGSESIVAPQRSDDTRVRPQMPIDYQNDYFLYSYRRNGSN